MFALRLFNSTRGGGVKTIQESDSKTVFLELHHVDLFLISILDAQRMVFYLHVPPKVPTCK